MQIYWTLSLMMMMMILWCSLVHCIGSSIDDIPSAAELFGQEESYHVVECVMPLYFLCQNNNCLPESHLCDGENDCGDNSDEDHDYCAQMKCNVTTEFKCNSGRCVPKASRCDRHPQCRDRSDELNCVYEPCPKGMFSCANHSQCLDMSEVCDGSIDCKDGLASDELHPNPCPANVTCPSSSFKCTGTNVCAQPNWMCDGENDCGDNSDENEENCKNFKCPDDWFRCADNRCILMNNVCNGVIDCKDGLASDERHPDPCPRNVTCPNDFFSCEETNICAHPHWLCDGADDCGDKSDEDIEKCANTPCPEDWFRCSNTQRCIPPNWRCDGSEDCRNGEDEIDCNNDYVHEIFIPENNTLVSYVNHSNNVDLLESISKNLQSINNNDNSSSSNINNQQMLLPL
ncbi:Low-density lipoprotein receptor domain class A [Dermatophagoides farinae]|uniref:Low-density lipoprotein receptor domain class A n=1 Tax=Dermatophagoides farinae TaxID=6954 RepID=A0A922HMF6_DERFA|nr:Low-density lipoprotein receptor domain class A [Dermatophagoides farinae]